MRSAPRSMPAPGWSPICFNGMSGVDHRAPGVAVAALLDDRVSTSVIADLVHVHADVVRLAFRCKPRGRIILVTDAVAWRGAHVDRLGITPRRHGTSSGRRDPRRQRPHPRPGGGQRGEPLRRRPGRRRVRRRHRTRPTCSAASTSVASSRAPEPTSPPSTATCAASAPGSAASRCSASDRRTVAARGTTGRVRSGLMDIVAAVFIENIELRPAPGPSTRIDLTGVHFSLAAPSPVPVTVEPHLVVLVRCRPRRAGHRRPRDHLHPRRRAGRPQRAAARRWSRASSPTGWCGPSWSSSEYDTVEADVRIDLGPVTTVPFTLLPPPGRS